MHCNLTLKPENVEGKMRLELELELEEKQGSDCWGPKGLKPIPWGREGR